MLCQAMPNWLWDQLPSFLPSFLRVLAIAGTRHGGSAVPSCGPHSLGLLLGVNLPLLATMSDPYQDGTGHLG